MSYSIEEVTDRTVVVQAGSKIDFRNADQLHEACSQKIRSGAKRFIFDFEETEVLDSTGLGAIFKLYRKLTAVSGGEPAIAFAGVGSQVEAALRLTRTGRVFEEYDSVDEAVAALEDGSAGAPTS